MKTLLLHPNDNVAVALVDLKHQETINIMEDTIKIEGDVSAKHKIVLKDLEVGDIVYMYGVKVGRAIKPIKKGAPITTANLTHDSGNFQENTTSKFEWSGVDIRRFESRTFRGYHRKDGQVGTDNIWLVFPLVFCENRNIETLKRAFEKALGYEKEDEVTRQVRELVGGYLNTQTAAAYPPVENRTVFDNIKIRFITHQGGCGGTREDAHTLCNLLAGYTHNPNVAGATVLSLGCQHSEMDIFLDRLKQLGCEKPLVLLEQQSSGTEKNLMDRAVKETFEALVKANQQERKETPLSKLTIGLECGGSDGFSGISANPAVGHVSDIMATLGGKSILSEFPELCGVEQELINRTTDSEDARKFISIMRAYEAKAELSGSGFDMNPSPGNIKDGLITDAIKSAGAAKKGGTSPVNGVMDYTEYVENPGLNLLCTPGNDVESTTGLAGSGANIILFTTGLGTPTGNPVTPVIKISSNTKTAERMSDIIDIDTGGVVRGEKSIEEMGEEIMEMIIKTASGEYQTKASRLNQHDFIPWKRGVSL